MVPVCWAATPMLFWACWGRLGATLLLPVNLRARRVWSWTSHSSWGTSFKKRLGRLRAGLPKDQPLEELHR